MRVRSATELETYLRTHTPDNLEVEYHEADHFGEWGDRPEQRFAAAARSLGYELGSRRAGGRGPFLGFVGGGNRHVIFTVTRARPRPSASGAPSARPVQAAGEPTFFRVWECTYLMDPVKQTHQTRVVHGTTRADLMAEARRKTPAGGQLDYLARAHDQEPIWRLASGYTAAADQPFPASAPKPNWSWFKDVPVGGQFRRAYLLSTCEKVDDMHGRLLDDGPPFEMDPYDSVLESW